jgi:hypothetical protein
MSAKIWELVFAIRALKSAAALAIKWSAPEGTVPVMVSRFGCSAYLMWNTSKPKLWQLRTTKG